MRGKMNFKLNHISIPRPINSDKIARDFYSGLLNLEEMPTPSALEFRQPIWYRLDENRELHIYVIESEQNVTTNRHFCLEAENNLKQLFTRLKDADIKVWEPVPVPDRFRFFCEDPFGNVIEFIQFYEK